MSNGISLHIGVNVADTAHYGNGFRELNGAVKDAIFWQEFAEKQGYSTQKLHDQEATVEAVKEFLAKYADCMQPGSILLLTYSGHGSEMSNLKVNAQEPMNQTWCLFNRQMLDDEIDECLSKFQEGVRIVVISDSCHSGSVTMNAGIDLDEMLDKGLTSMAESRGFMSRKVSDKVKNYVAYHHKEKTYKQLLEKYRYWEEGKSIKASVKLFAACQDNQTTLDGPENGFFTAAFAKVLADKQYWTANAEALQQAVRGYYRNNMSDPMLSQYGGIITSFDESFPFKIEISNALSVTGHREAVIVAPPPPPPMEIPPATWLFNVTQNKHALLRLEVTSLDTPFLEDSAQVKILHKDADNRVLTLEVQKISMDQAWAAAHALQTAFEKHSDYRVMVEPLLSAAPAPLAITETREAGSPDLIPEWPPFMSLEEVNIAWHLDEQHSQLAIARQAVADRQDIDPAVRIAHLDTGYLPGHPALPENLNSIEACSFVNGEKPNEAIDLNGGQDGHGMGTIALLAGGNVDAEHTYGEYQGYIGGAPFAEIIPMRISDRVDIWNGDNFAKAIERAIALGCEVVTMSMAGKPDRRMAAAVNRAYEAGIVIVSAASNCWYAGPGMVVPKCVLYPAAFQRVIAATGALYNHRPYDEKFLNNKKIDTKYMQGCWGPASRMKKALAAYTPNVPWASAKATRPAAFLRSGGGTSSATPQIAAAAALWIAYHRAELEAKGYYKEGECWKKVEAVRYALFTSAAKGDIFPEWEKYYGNGILRAYDALQIGVADESQLHKAPEAESSFMGLWETAQSFFLNRIFRDEVQRPESDALAQELLHLLHFDPALREEAETIDTSDKSAAQSLVDDPTFRKKVLDSVYASDFLKGYM